MPCPLCHAPAPLFFDDAARGWPYSRCGACRLVFRHPETFWTPQREKERYATHDNSPQDAGYVAFLSPVVEAVRARLPAGAAGLDYGSGPGPVLSALLSAAGFAMSLYDPHFAPDERPLELTYDFVTCTETVEHFHRPAQEFERLGALLKPGGRLFVMTRVLEASEDFSLWWYRQDPTHVCFYAPETLAWLADRYGWSLERPAPSLAVFLG